MNELQRVIKYLAMAAAIFLSCIIIYGIVSSVLLLTDFLEFRRDSDDSNNRNNTEISQTYESIADVDNISIDHSFGNLTIKTGDVDMVEVASDDLKDDLDIKKTMDGTLIIKSRRDFRDLFDRINRDEQKGNITIYIPKGYDLTKLKIDAGAGNILLEDLTVEKLDIDAGAGVIFANNIKADSAILDGGVGDMRFLDVTFENADLDCGVGNMTVTGYLLGKSDIDCGVGEVNLEIKGTVDDYNLKIEKGLGTILVNGTKFSDLEWNNISASNALDISGGLGNIDINFVSP